MRDPMGAVAGVFPPSDRTEASFDIGAPPQEAGSVLSLIEQYCDPIGVDAGRALDVDVTHDELVFSVSLIVDLYAEAKTTQGRTARTRSASEVVADEAKDDSTSEEARKLAASDVSFPALAAALAPRMAKLRIALSTIPLVPMVDCTPEEYAAREPPERDGMLAFDAVLAAELRELGAAGVLAAKTVVEAATERWAQRKQRSPLETWKLWIPVDDTGARATPPAIRNMLIAIWREEVLPKLVAPTLSMAVVTVNRDEHAKLQKVAVGISWGFGAPGVRVKVDDDEYATTPTIATKLVPRTYALLPSDHGKRPHQTSLPLDYGGAPEVLPVAMTDATQYAISPVGAKLAILVLADQVIRGGKLSQVQLGDLAKRVHPLATRIQPRELETSARALDELRRLFLYLPDGTKVQVFDVQSPANAKTATADMRLHLGLTRTMVTAMSSLLESDAGNGRSYRGEFLVNMSGLMRLPNKQPALLRHAMRAAAHWNAAFNPSTGAFDPNKLRTYSLEEWAIMTNSLAPAAADYLHAKRRGAQGPDRRRQLSQETHRIGDELEQLAKEHHIIVLEKKAGKLVILPPESWREARGQMKKSGGRPSRKPEG